MIPYTRLILNLVLSSIFYIEEMLTIICKFTNALNCLLLNYLDPSFHCKT